MAKIKLPDFIKSASGTISRKKMADGSVRSLVITKKGTIYETTYQRRTIISPEEKAQRARFGIICSAFAFARKELHLPADPDTRKKAFAALSGIYDRMVAHDRTVTPEQLATMYAYQTWSNEKTI